ncbi:MAG: right-handed parallel beta-helix repeat-containing protein [Myxococcales bacterium]|nr:right-handed parallel beta-helix repeat-containing protein [Myxococcales bacterium]
MRRVFIALSISVWAVGCNGGDTGLNPITTPDGAIDADQDGFVEDLDCNDADAEVFPGAPEFCGDGRITDCDRQTEDNTITMNGTEAFDDLQEALDAAPADATLVVCPGTYLGNFRALDSVQLQSLSGADVTILQGAGEGPVFVARSDTTITGFTIQGGSAEEGGGVNLLDAGDLTIEDSVIAGNSADNGGGIYVIDGSNVQLTGTVIRDNVASDTGGGAYVSNLGSLQLDAGSSIEDNHAVVGGGVMLVASRLEGGEVKNNTVSSKVGKKPTEKGKKVEGPAGPSGGSGVAASGKSSVVDTAIFSNECTGNAQGAVLIFDDGDVTLNDLRIRLNQSEDGAAGLFVRGIVRLINGTDVFDNISLNGDGVGANVLGGSLFGGTIREHDGTGVFIEDGLIDGTTITMNQNSGGAGGIQGRGNVTLRNCALERNDGAAGGGIAWSRTTPNATGEQLIIDSCAIRGNSVSGLGGGVFGSDVEITNSTVSDNVAARGAGLYVTHSLQMVGGALVRNTAMLNSTAGGGIFYQPPNATAYAEPAITISAVDMGFGTNDNSPNDVLFVDTTGPDSYSNYGTDVSFDCFKDQGCSTP